MRGLTPVILSIAGALSPAAACELKWPDPEIAIPIEVRAFITAECADFQGLTDEDVGACLSGEAYAYRAVVEMLADSDDGDRAAERYRECRGGLGAFGGRFHRRKADCVGSAFGYKWRFDFSDRAALADDRRRADAAFPGHMH